MGIESRDSIYAMEQCYSGGMLDDIIATVALTGMSACAMSAARFDEVSWAADTEGNYDEYVFHWTSAVYGQDPNAQTVNADSDMDGFISMSEAHEYAQLMDSANETPQIFASPIGACDTNLVVNTPIGDLDGNGCVDLSDLTGILLPAIGSGLTDPQFDLNGDGDVNIADARRLVTLFSNPRGASCH